MKISFLVPTLGSRENELKRLLNSLENQILKDFEVILVVQDNYDKVLKICDKYKKMNTNCIYSNKKGLSINRNLGLKYCNGDIIILSDDDCWYPNYATIELELNFKGCDILLSQIYDKKNNKFYKKYSQNKYDINHRLELMSKSSIEIAFSKKIIDSIRFDESFGLGAQYICGEEVDFLLNAYINGYKIKYIPKIMVYHAIKEKNTYKADQIVAKGALYAKHFNIIYGIFVCIRDLILKRENNITNFFRGYYEYIKRNS